MNATKGYSPDVPCQLPAGPIVKPTMKGEQMNITSAPGEFVTITTPVEPMTVRQYAAIQFMAAMIDVRDIPLASESRDEFCDCALDYADALLMAEQRTLNTGERA